MRQFVPAPCPDCDCMGSMDDDGCATCGGDDCVLVCRFCDEMGCDDADCKVDMLALRETDGGAE